MSEQEKTFVDQLREQLRSQLQNPVIFRVSVLTLIGLLGLGGFGLQLYFKIGRLKADYENETARTDLMDAHVVISGALRNYKSRLSPNTEFIEWISDLRELARQNNLQVLSINPTLLQVKDPKAMRKLLLNGKFSGGYRSVVRFLGTLQNRKEKIHVADFVIAPPEKKADSAGETQAECSVALAVLMPPAGDKKKTGKEAKPKPEEPKPSEAKPAEQEPERPSSKTDFSVRTASSPAAAGEVEVSTRAPEPAAQSKFDLNSKPEQPDARREAVQPSTAPPEFFQGGASKFRLGN